MINSEKRDVLVTIRMSEEERDRLYKFAESRSSSITDVVIRGCKYYLAISEDIFKKKDGEKSRSNIRNTRVHARLPSSLVENIKEFGAVNSVSQSDFVRNAVFSWLDSLHFTYYNW